MVSGMGVHIQTGFSDWDRRLKDFLAQLDKTRFGIVSDERNADIRIRAKEAEEGLWFFFGPGEGEGEAVRIPEKDLGPETFQNALLLVALETECRREKALVAGLVSGVGHAVENQLTGILGTAELLALDVSVGTIRENALCVSRLLRLLGGAFRVTEETSLAIRMILDVGSGVLRSVCGCPVNPDPAPAGQVMVKPSVFFPHLVLWGHTVKRYFPQEKGLVFGVAAKKERVCFFLQTKDGRKIPQPKAMQREFACDLKASSPAVAEKPETEEHPLILVVDDERFIRELTGKMLVRLGYTALFAENCESALAMLATHGGKIGCVLLDVAMPGTDGLACLDRIREKDGKVRVIMATGHDVAEEEERFRNAGAMGAIQKPYGLDALERAVAAAVSGKNLI